MTKKIKLPYKLLIYDLETSPLKAWVWRCGSEIAVRHGQLDVKYKNYQILTISYKWYGEKEVYTLVGKNAVEEFDKIIRKADVTLGKNSDSFDVKHINTQRMLQDLPPLPQWINQAEDLEKQMRRYFVFPSQSLDYISDLFGTGGKMKMEFSDWTDIMNAQLLLEFPKRMHEKASQILFFKSAILILKLGKTALNKMCVYNKKDITDTEFALTKVLAHIKLRKNASVSRGGTGCITCGSSHILQTKVVTAGQTKYQEFYCNDHEGYAGRAAFKYDKYHHKLFGKMS